MGVIDAKTNQWLYNMPTGSNAHSISVDPRPTMFLCRFSLARSAQRWIPMVASESLPSNKESVRVGGIVCLESDEAGRSPWK